MISFIGNINKDGKVALSLLIAEKMFKMLDGNDENYKLGRNALDRCWEWLHYKKIDADDLCDYIESRDEEVDIFTVSSMSDDTEYEYMWYALLYAVSYVTWQAYYNENRSKPGKLDNVTDETIVYLCETAIKSEFLSAENIDKVKNYFVEHYSIWNEAKNKPVFKEVIMKELDSNDYLFY